MVMLEELLLLVLSLLPLGAARVYPQQLPEQLLVARAVQELHLLRCEIILLLRGERVAEERAGLILSEVAAALRAHLLVTAALAARP
jgi:hypothetical protein